MLGPISPGELGVYRNAWLFVIAILADPSLWRPFMFLISGSPPWLFLEEQVGIQIDGARIVEENGGMHLGWAIFLKKPKGNYANKEGQFF